MPDPTPNTEAAPSEPNGLRQWARGHRDDSDGMSQHRRAQVCVLFDQFDALTAAYAIRLPPLLAELEGLRNDYAALVEHHRQCELAGTRLAELVKREVTGEGDLPPVDDNVLMEAVEAWDAHQWPALARQALEEQSSE